jgi:hypothetical protein
MFRIVNIGLLDKKFILYDNYQDVQAGFSHAKYQERVIRYHAWNKCIQHNDRMKKSRRTYNDLNTVIVPSDVKR